MGNSGEMNTNRTAVVWTPRDISMLSWALQIRLGSDIVVLDELHITATSPTPAVATSTVIGLRGVSVSHPVQSTARLSESSECGSAQKRDFRHTTNGACWHMAG
ncbi:unnamed protein product [Cercospora beticola]|nr:unnamed protein product [Cercospora beticola]